MTNLENSLPTSIPQQQGGMASSPSMLVTPQEQKVIDYVVGWRNSLRQARWDRQNLWLDCWALYRGQEDWSDKEDWQSQITPPDAWNSVKQATNAVKRFLRMMRRLGEVEAVNKDDLVMVLRAERMEHLARHFLDRADWVEGFAEALENSFIMGLGVMKVWWGLVPRMRMRVEDRLVEVPSAFGGGMGMGDGMAGFNPMLAPTGTELGEFGQQNAMLYPPQLAGEALNPAGWGGGMAQQAAFAVQKEVIREEVLEGRLFVRAVDPFMFYWLPGSKPNKWVGTIEDIELPKYEITRLAEEGLFDSEKVAKIQPSRLDEQIKRSSLRFSENIRITAGPNADTGAVRLLEFYGPIVLDGRLVEKHGHVIIANDSLCLTGNGQGYTTQTEWHQKPPYIGFSPLALPFRTEGVGIIEMGRSIIRAMGKLLNMSMDSLTYRLTPTFEVVPDLYENPEDFETGITPGKLFRRTRMSGGQQAMIPVQFQDISQGSVQTMSQLDREFQRASLTPEIQQAVPRYKGNQTATESNILQDNLQSFLGAMASDIEHLAIEPLVEMALDLILQYIDTANDPRVASILGVGADLLRGMGKAELMELVTGDYKVKVSGITEELNKAEQLKALIQLMNLIGQNAQVWAPAVNPDALLRRILESFPMIRDIDEIVADPATMKAKQEAMGAEGQQAALLGMIPQLAQMAMQAQQQQSQQGMDAAKMAQEMAMQQQEMGMRERELEASQAAAKASAPQEAAA